MEPLANPLCYFCKSFFRSRIKEGFFCKAFPEGIPDEIFFEIYDHRKKFKGDQGILFEEDPAHPVQDPYWLKKMGKETG